MAGAFTHVQAARQKNRPTAQFYIDHLFTGFLEMHGDRRFADDRAIVAGIARLDQRAVTVIGIEKGVDTGEKIMRNFGSAHPEGYRKALRQMQLAEKFGRPVICLIDTAGAFCGIGAEERGQGQAIAENLMTMMGLRVPIISILIGEGGSGGALALAVADRVWMLENAVYSVISPEGAASIIWKDAGKAEEASEALKLTAQDLLAFEIVERVFSEENGNFDKVTDTLHAALTEELQALCAMEDTARSEQRYRRFRRMGGNAL
ncbi:MAG TPA: acetyl-CoA carboxylase carboxyltransferase subunit alpha [Candidatus Limiplasma sp.]|nr:acetyl-CoA carboxylase carboxyltransferase subunit alpha [Candidatus Limiplasma sp.]